MAMNMMGDAPAAGGNEAAPDGKPGYLICLHVSGDGLISVGVEPDSEESSEPADMLGGSEETKEAADYKPVASMDEALAMARTIYRNNGQMPQDPDMEAARSGYAKRAMDRSAMRSAPGGVFGE